MNDIIPNYLLALNLIKPICIQYMLMCTHSVLHVTIQVYSLEVLKFIFLLTCTCTHVCSFSQEKFEQSHIRIIWSWSLILYYEYIKLLFSIFFSVFQQNSSSQDIQCTKNILYDKMDMADSCVLQKTSFKVTTTEAQEEEGYYEN